MGLSEIVRSGSLALIGVSLTAAGCQQSGPLRLSVASEEVAPSPANGIGRVPADPKDAPYVNPVWQEEDPPGPIMTTVHIAGSAVGAVVDPLVEVPTKGIQWLAGDRPSAADRLLEDRTSPDNRRDGMNKLVNFGFLNNDLFVRRCREIAAQPDVDFTVRATAIRTGNRARDTRATAIFIKGLGDSDEWVRLESAKALANVPDVTAAGPLADLLGNRDQSRDVRVAAADALKHYRTLAVVRMLSSTLSDKTFAVAWQSRRSLRYLTGRDYGYDGAAWLAYFTGPEKPLG